VRRGAGALKEEVADWCEGRSWAWRAPILAYLAYAGVRHLADPLYASLFGGINLGIHELGHMALSFAGQWVMVLGGSLFQLAAPLVAAFLLLRQPDYFALPVCGAWFSTNLYSVATYMADARALDLSLVTVGADGGEVEHDWNYLLQFRGPAQLRHHPRRFRTPARLSPHVVVRRGGRLDVLAYGSIAAVSARRPTDSSDNRQSRGGETAFRME
jgi:hypothetical protein